jgi:hypothetical protein
MPTPRVLSEKKNANIHAHAGATSGANSGATGKVPLMTWLSNAAHVEEADMKAVTTIHTKRLALVAFSLALSQTPLPAAAASTSGAPALALAAVVGSYSSVLGVFNRRGMARLLAGLDLRVPRTQKIVVTADTVTCRTSNVDIAARSCELTFKDAKRTLSGREANELFATLAVAGIAADGAAGSNIVAIKQLECTIDPTVISQKSGGGADCTYTAGP